MAQSLFTRLSSHWNILWITLHTSVVSTSWGPSENSNLARYARVVCEPLHRQFFRKFPTIHFGISHLVFHWNSRDIWIICVKLKNLSLRYLLTILTRLNAALKASKMWVYAFPSTIILAILAYHGHRNCSVKTVNNSWAMQCTVPSHSVLPG